MKKLLASLMAGAILSASSCAVRENEIPSTEPTASEQTEPDPADQAQNHREIAQALSEQMANGEFSDCAARFSDEMRASLDESALKSAWTQIVSAAGDYVGVYDVSESEKNGSVTAVTTLEYTKTGVTVTFVFDAENAVEGLWLNYRTLPAASESEAFTETKIQIGEYRLDGILTLPVNAENPSVAILIQGSGQSDFDETAGMLKPFRDLAHGLAENGIASIRFNKRFYQRLELADEIDVTIQTEVLEDVSAAIQFAQNRSDLNGESLFLIGHSLGGMLAPVIAEENAAVRGIVSLAGSPRRLEDIMCSQYEYQLRQHGISEEEIKEKTVTVHQEAERVKTLSDGESGEYFNVSGVYWKSLNEVDTAGAALALEIPMLFLQGGADVQVYADIDFTEWQELLAGKENCRFRLYEGLGHFFNDEEGKVDPAVIEEIAGFIWE